MADPATYPQADWQGHPLYYCPQDGCGYSSLTLAKVTAHVEAQHPEPVVVEELAEAESATPAEPEA